MNIEDGLLPESPRTIRYYATLALDAETDAMTVGFSTNRFMAEMVYVARAIGNKQNGVVQLDPNMYLFEGEDHKRYWKPGSSQPYDVLVAPVDVDVDKPELYFIGFWGEVSSAGVSVAGTFDEVRSIVSEKLGEQELQFNEKYNQWEAKQGQARVLIRQVPVDVVREEYDRLYPDNFSIDDIKDIDPFKAAFFDDGYLGVEFKEDMSIFPGYEDVVGATTVNLRLRPGEIIEHHMVQSLHRQVPDAIPRLIARLETYGETAGLSETERNTIGRIVQELRRFHT